MSSTMGMSADKRTELNLMYDRHTSDDSAVPRARSQFLAINAEIWDNYSLGGDVGVSGDDSGFEFVHYNMLNEWMCNCFSRLWCSVVYG